MVVSTTGSPLRSASIAEKLTVTSLNTNALSAPVLLNRSMAVPKTPRRAGAGPFARRLRQGDFAQSNLVFGRGSGNKDNNRKEAGQPLDFLQIHTRDPRQRLIEEQLYGQLLGGPRELSNRSLHNCRRGSSISVWGRGRVLYGEGIGPR